MTAPIVLPADMCEDAWTAWVIELAMRQGWKVQHVRPARTAKGWRTPVQGHTGAPDLLLARNGDLLLPELKKNGSYPRADQREWLAHLGPYGRVWRPRDADQVLQRLRRNV
jgi:hypothetical protein